LALSNSLKEDPSPEITSEIIVVESSTDKGKQSENKKKGKRKAKKGTHSKEKSNKNEPSDEKKKLRYPCLICDEDHYTKECPHLVEVSKFVKISPTPTVLKDPFPPQDSKMVSHDHPS